MASNNTGTWLQKSAIRQNTETRSPFLPCCIKCLDQEEWVHGLWIHPGQVRWCGDLKPPPVEPTVCVDMSQHVEMVDADTEDLGWLRRLRSCLEGRDLKEKETQIACCPGDLFHTHKKETREGPGPVLPRISPSASTLSP